MQKIQILAIITTILLAILALCYKNTENIKIKSVVQKYKLYYIYNIIFYLSNIVAILFYKLKIDAIILILIIIYFIYLSLDLISGRNEEENEIYTIINMLFIIVFVLIVSIKYILILEILR